MNIRRMVSARLLPPGKLRVPNGYPMTTTLSLASELERIANAVERDAASTSQVSLPGIAERIAKNLGVKPDEVALMGVSPVGATFIFSSQNRSNKSALFLFPALPP